MMCSPPLNYFFFFLVGTYFPIKRKRRPIAIHLQVYRALSKENLRRGCNNSSRSPLGGRVTKHGLGGQELSALFTLPHF